MTKTTIQRERLLIGMNVTFARWVFKPGWQLYLAMTVDSWSCPSMSSQRGGTSVAMALTVIQTSDFNAAREDARTSIGRKRAQEVQNWEVARSIILLRILRLFAAIKFAGC